MTAPTEDLIERADMIVAELQGLPHVTETVRGVSDRLRSLQNKLTASEDENARWLSRMADVREASGIGMKPMLSEVPDALRALVERLNAADARLHAITRDGKCPRCELTKAQCADTIAEIEIGRRSALNTGSGEG